jgi:hypothetical protein
VRLSWRVISGCCSPGSSPRPISIRGPHDPVLGSVYDLGQGHCHFGLALAIGVAAYLIGSASQAAGEGLMALLRRGTQHRGLRWLGRIVNSGLAGFGRPEWIEQARQKARNEVESPATFAGADIPTATAVRAQAYGLIEHRTNQAAQSAARELDIPATPLVGEKPGVFAEVDRLRSEGDLRAAAVLPLVALCVALAINQGLWWILGLGFVVVISAAVSSRRERSAPLPPLRRPVRARGSIGRWRRTPLRRALCGCVRRFAP